MRNSRPREGGRRRLDDTDARDARYQGRGLGARLLDALLDWSQREGFAAVVAKGVSSERAVMAFMGAQPAAIYRSRGFTVEASWVDPELRALAEERRLLPAATNLDEAARVACCVLRL